MHLPMFLLLVAISVTVKVTTSSYSPLPLAFVVAASSSSLARSEPWTQELTRSEGESSKDWVETCNTHMTQMKISFPGCVSKSILTYACKGTCYSRSTPKWKAEVEEVTTVQHCMCCKPLARRFRLVTLDCPARAKAKAVLVSAAADCRCRPCSDAQPEGEKPYDY